MNGGQVCLNERVRDRIACGSARASARSALGKETKDVAARREEAAASRRSSSRLPLARRPRSLDSGENETGIPNMLPFPSRPYITRQVQLPRDNQPRSPRRCLGRTRQRREKANCNERITNSSSKRGRGRRCIERRRPRENKTRSCRRQPDCSF